MIAWKAAKPAGGSPMGAKVSAQTLALTYTKPGSDPMVRDTALTTGNAAATAIGIEPRCTGM